MVNLSKVIIVVLTSIFTQFSYEAYAFTLVSGRAEAKLNVDQNTPTITFRVSPTPPNFETAKDFMDGRYADKSPAEIWDAVLKEAMKQWNEVPESYVQLDFEYATDAELDSKDYVHTIMLSDTNLSSSAYAKPMFEDGIIYDCDVAMSTRKGSATNIAYTLLHELGHCLGLGHNHSDWSAVMGYTRQDRSLGLGADDIAGLIYLYPSQQIETKAQDLLLACGSIGTVNKHYPISTNVLLALLTPLILLFMRRMGLAGRKKKVFS